MSRRYLVAGKKNRKYNYSRRSLWPKPHRYRYKMPVEFKLIKLAIILLFIFTLLLMTRNIGNKSRPNSMQDKITSLEVPVDVTEKIFTKAKNNNKDAASLLASYIIGKKPGLFASRQSKNTYKEAVGCYKQFLFDLERFPIDRNYDYVYEDTWRSERTYGGSRKHYGTDIMDRQNKRSSIPIVSMSSGQVENIGWNDMGGYRIGVRTKNGAYIYYAHLDKYAPNIEKGSRVEAGDLLGYMGDSGYGKEGTIGKFQVHLHIGIATKAFGSDEQWVNPYYLLKYLEKKDVEILKSRGLF